ncbi:MAG: UDP-N-acetylglucosamine 1-carboxyvinyltransferase [Clostridiales bacterium]|nr:UDP-N-acetylglucosamine 1-carboxyvinyltransferase [Clostridiales bacterium]
MEKYMINGGRKLSGKITIQSAKNSVLPIMAGALLTDEQVVIKNCPKIKDVMSMLNILSHIGCKWQFEGDNLIINSLTADKYVVPKELANEMRSSIFMLGALICRFKKAKIYAPGGCNIGLRPIDLHIKSLKKLGVNVSEVQGQIFCSASSLVGKDIYLDFPSVGATENIILASVLAKGKTQIFNSAKEPEIVDLMNYLNSMGAKIYGAGTSTILIEGVDRLHGTEYTPIPDRIECGTFLLATAITGGEIEIHNCNAKNISVLIHKLCDNTCKITTNNDIIYLKNKLMSKSFSFSTGPYPLFPTDLQAQTMALLSVSSGKSVVVENVFEKRFSHVSSLIDMGANISVKGKRAYISGVNRLNGTQVYASDLRGGAALVLAGLNAEGQTIVNNISHIERGYFEFEKKLSSLGADIKKIY